jgi:hypothetical protein
MERQYSIKKGINTYGTQPVCVKDSGQYFIFVTGTVCGYL